MTNLIAKAAALALIGLGAFFSSPASAGDATGVWIDHTGRGAVEITNCGGALCGKLVWLKDAGNNSACGTKILGNVKSVAGGKFDNGWIYDPEANRKYSVEITPQGGSLKVMGYAGSKMLSETMIWHRAPSSLKKCTA